METLIAWIIGIVVVLFALTYILEFLGAIWIYIVLGIVLYILVKYSDKYFSKKAEEDKIKAEKREEKEKWIEDCKSKNIKYLDSDCFIYRLKNNLLSSSEKGQLLVEEAAIYNSSNFHNLLKYGADVNYQYKQKGSENSDTAIVNAIFYSQIDNIKTLIEHGADINLEDADGFTALMYASNKHQEEIAQLLLDNGADVSHKSKFNTTALMSFGKIDDSKITQLLLEKGANIDHQQKYGHSTLILAINREHINIIQNLIKNGANIHLKDFEERSPLTHAIIKGNSHIVQILLDAGANIEDKRADGASPLMIACLSQEEKKEIIKVLLANGADIEAVNNQGITSLALLLNLGKQEQTKILLEEIKILIEYGAKFDANQNTYIRTLSNIFINNECETLHEVVWNDASDELVKILIKNGIDINNKNNDGETALMYAQSKETVSSLLNHGTNINEVDNNNIPLYMNIAKYGTQEALNEILRKIENPLFKRMIAQLNLLGHERIKLTLEDLELNQLGARLTYSTQHREHFEWESKLSEVKKLLGLENIELSTDLANERYLVQVYKDDIKEVSLARKLRINGIQPIFVEHDEKNYTTYLFFKPLSGITLEQWNREKVLIEHELHIPVDIELYDDSHYLYPQYGTEPLIAIIESAISVMPDELNIGGKYLKTVEKGNGFIEYQFTNVKDITKWDDAKEQIIKFVKKRINIVQEGTIVKLEESIEEMIPRTLGLHDSQKRYPKLYDVVVDGDNKRYFYTFLPEVDLNVWKEYSRKTNFKTLFNEPDKVYRLDIYDRTNHKLYDPNFYEGQLIVLNELAKIPKKEEIQNSNIIDELEKEKIFWGYGSGSEKYYTNINETTHTMLIGGTGSGKSNLMNGIILSLLHNIGKIDKLYLFDLKDGTEFLEYQQLESDKVTVFGEETTPVQLLDALLEIEAEMRLRNLCIIDRQRQRISKDKKITESPIFMIIDEFSAIEALDEYSNEDRMAKDDIFRVLTRLAKQSRSANIKIFAQSQEPRDIIRSGIAEQLLSRVLLRTKNELDAQHVITQYETMNELGINHTALDMGRFIFEDLSQGIPIVNELQFPYVDTDKDYHQLYKYDVNTSISELSKELDVFVDIAKTKYPVLKNTKRLNPNISDYEEKTSKVESKTSNESVNDFSEINSDYLDSLDLLAKLEEKRGE